MLINVLYRPPSGLILAFEIFLKDVFNKTKSSNKNSMIPIINKPTRVARQSATAVDHILKNCFVNFDFKTAIFKCDISDHFPISLFYQ